MYSKILPVVYNKKEYLKYLSNVFDASRADEIVEVLSSLKENVVTEAENVHANLLKNNSRSTTSSSSLGIYRARDQTETLGLGWSRSVSVCLGLSRSHL